MLGHHVHSEAVQVCVGELAVGALVHLGERGEWNGEKEQYGEHQTGGQIRAACSEGLLGEELQIRRESGPPFTLTGRSL